LLNIVIIIKTIPNQSASITISKNQDGKYLRDYNSTQFCFQYGRYQRMGSKFH